MKKLLENHAMNYKFAPHPKFAISPISIKDNNYDFSVDLSLISNDDAIEHINKFSSLSLMFSHEKKIQQYYLTKLFSFSLKDKAKTWFKNLAYGSIKSP